MTSALRVGMLMIVFLVALAACAAPASSVPVSTSTPTVRQQAVKAAPSDRVELASGRYQLLMFYSPL